MSVLFWLPRILALAFAVFLALFSLDKPFGVGFFMHLIPTYAVIAVALIFWKFDQIAGGAFIILGVVATIFYGTYRNPLTFLIISGPFFLIGVLYLFLYFRSHPGRKPLNAN